MKSPLSVLTHNIGLKLLSLILAVVIYYAVKESVARHDRKDAASVFMKGAANANPAR